MSFKNTPINYGTVAKWLHWVTALLFLAAYASVYYRHWFTHSKTPENWTALQLHLSIGVTIAVLVVLRIIWRISHSAPELEPGSKLEHRAARAGHGALYAIMVVAPVTGYLGTGVNVDYFFLFEIAKFESTGLFAVISDGLDITFKQFEKPIDLIHKKVLGEWLIWLLILGHVLAALYHHFIKKDGTLLKMTTGKP